jgi:hypothetical protein
MRPRALVELGGGRRPRPSPGAPAGNSPVGAGFLPQSPQSRGAGPAPTERTPMRTAIIIPALDEEDIGTVVRAVPRPLAGRPPAPARRAGRPRRRLPDGGPPGGGRAHPVAAGGQPAGDGDAAPALWPPPERHRALPGHPRVDAPGARDGAPHLWPVEMIVKAANKGYRVVNVPVSCRRRLGRSKVSGTVRGSVLAGYHLVSTTVRYAGRR